MTEIEKFVDDTYLKVLQRRADSEGLQVYTEHILEGRLQKEDLERILKESAEYKDKLARLDANAFLPIAQIVGNVPALNSNGKLNLSQIGVKVDDLADLWNKTTKHITSDIDPNEFNVTNKLLRLDDDAKIPLAQSTFRQAATLIVAASDSLHPERADYQCDGVDDQVEIQAAIDALPASGGKVLLLEGLYIKSSTTGISVPSNVEIEILGGATIQFVDGIDADAQIFINSNSVSGNANIVIHGSGILDGNRANQTSGEQSAIKLTKVSKSTIDISMKNFRSYNVQEVSPSVGNKIINREFPNVAIRKNDMLSRLEAHPLWKLLDAFETDWVTIQGTITYDTSRKHSGTRSIKMITTVGDKASAEKAVSPTIDMSKKSHSMWFYTEDASKIADIVLYLRSGGNWTQYRVDKYRERIDERFLVNNRWQRAGVLNKIVSGAFDATAVDMVKVVITAKAGEIATVWCDEISYATQSIARNGMITFIFDDGYESVYTKAKQYFDKYNCSACTAVITNSIGSGTLMTKTQLEELQQSGWDICAHSLTHAYAKDGINVEDSYALIEEEALGSQDWLIQHGFSKGARFYILPGGYNSAKYIDIIEKYFVANRMAREYPTTGVPLPVVDPRLIHGRGITAITDVADIERNIDSAFNAKSWFVFFLHDIVDAGAVDGEWNKIDLETVIDYINSKNMPIVTFSQVFDDILFAPTQTMQYSDLFMDVLAVSATHIRSNEDLSEAIPNTFTLDAQPDVPRTLSGHFDAHAQITAYTIVITGVDAKGNTVTETFTEAASPWDFETVNAYATITSIIMTARTGTGAGDTMDIGITDVLGLSNIIYETGDVFKITKTTGGVSANAVVAAAQVSTVYDTYDMAVIGLAGGDNFTIWYRSNLNIIT